MIIKNTLFFIAIALTFTPSVKAQNALPPLKIEQPQLLAEAPILPDVKLQPKNTSRKK